MVRITSIAAPALVAALAAGAAPASAEMHRYHADPPRVAYASFGETANLQRSIARLDGRIERALARHRLSRREAAGLRRDVDRLDALFAQYRRGGLTRYEARALEARIARVQRSLRSERRDSDRRRG